MNSKFAHRHYVAIAEVLAQLGAMAATCEAFADMFARDNARFDRNRFLAAAHGEPTNGRDGKKGTKPMKYLEHETAAYSLHSDHFGNFELVRRWDVASAYFQGDDATLWRANIDCLVAIDQSPTGWSANNSFDQSFDCLCSGYDDVLS